MITNDTANSENLLQTYLEGIDFIHSRLPKESLEYRSNEGQKYGDLEQTARGLAQAIRKNPISVDVDIRKIDQKLLVLAQRFKDAIEHGDKNTAFAAKGALARGILDIRNKIPLHQTELIEQFVELNTKYLDEWLTLISFAQLADRTSEKAEKVKAKYDQEKSEYDEDLEDLYGNIQDDPNLREAFAFVRAQSSTASKSTWTPEQRKVYGMMLDQRFKRINIDFNAYLFQTEQTTLQRYLNDVELLSVKLAGVPIAVDENQMNKYKEAIDGLFKELAEKDTELAETLTMLDEIEGRLQQLETSPGNQMAKAVAATEAEIALEKMKQREREKIGERNAKRHQGIRDLGLHTKEEVSQMKKEVEEENQRNLERLAEEADEYDTDEDQDVDGEQNYN